MHVSVHCEALAPHFVNGMAWTCSDSDTGGDTRPVVAMLVSAYFVLTLKVQFMLP